jgi:cytochrome c oxidase subunit I+III
VLALGVAVIVVDVCLSARRGLARRNPWDAGTLEWLARPRRENWGVRSVPRIGSRYPLWDEPGFMKNVDEGRFYLPDAEEGKRELMITSVLDAHPLQVARIGMPTVKPLLAAVTLGGVFVLTTFHLYAAAVVSGLAALGAILWWLWTGTGIIPEKPAKNAGLGEVLPLFAYGPGSAGWWAMFITMIADATALAGLLFGYFYFWTIHPEFPPADAPGITGPGEFWPMVSLALILAGWVLTIAAREANRRALAGLSRMALAVAAACMVAGGVAALAGPRTHDMDPALHAYPAMVWILAIWIAVHALVGALMQLYALARSLAGRMTAVHDGDVRNVTLYVHFLALSAFVTFVVLAFFPEVA